MGGAGGDAMQVRLGLAGFLEEMAGLGFGPRSSSPSHSLGLDVNVIFS